MKRIICMVLTVFLVVVAVTAQDAPKKKAGFWNKVKKGVESATGVDVSKETLFVYPELGQWKMELKSAEGDPVTGNVTVIFNVMPLAGQKGTAIKMAGIIGGDGRELVAGEEWEYGSNHHDITAGKFTEYELRRITVSPDMKSLKSVLFTVGNKEGFEARDIPITWITKE